MNQVWRRVVAFYQERRPLVDNGFQAAALTVLAGLVLQTPVTAVYPPQWVTVLLIAVFLLGTRSPGWGYTAAIGVVLWPLWHLSPYLMALFLAVTVLGRSIILDHLPWALLVVATPLLAQGYLIALPPLVAGLLGGATTGLWVGLCAAFWAKLFGGMGALPVDLLSLNEYAFSANALAERFAGANSLETLRLLVAPFAPDSLSLLLHILQIVAWGTVGYAVGRLRNVSWTDHLPRVACGAATLVGVGVAWAGVYVVPVWLQLASFEVVWRTPGTHLGLLVSGLLAFGVYQLHHAVRRPVVWPRRVRVQRGWPTVATSPEQVEAQEAIPPDEDLIMIELD